ncbi:site-specific integrase [Brevundimonas sp.]|uniref:tyrosine-type recombinase/integrase n=1 Tax=Brevundimonas sp. TaxID=1871086 RepID=UPI00262A4997|nr:site-specific integrase [Brevundimonas sp.]
MESRKARITKRSVDALATPAEGEARLWDTDVHGFFLRVYSSGRRVYALKYRLGPRQRVYTLGVHGSPLTPESARAAAEAALRRVAQGEDPATEKKEAREALTVAQLIQRYIDDGPATKPGKRDSTWAIDSSNLNCHIHVLLGQHVANSLTKADAAKAIQDITNGKTATSGKGKKARGRTIVRGGAGTARRTLTTAAAMFAWGMEHGLVKSNPFASVKLIAAPLRERFLSREEAASLLDALDKLEASKTVDQRFGNAIRLLLLTGARKTEILGLKWSEIDVARKLILLPPERTKAGGQNGERRIFLSPPALQILAKCRPKDAKPEDYVFPALRGEGHIIGVRRVFAKACAEAKLEGVRLHDLRHSFASFAVADGASLFLVSKLLGHASSRTSERYAHLSGDPLQDAVSAISERLMEGRPPILADTEVDGEAP